MIERIADWFVKKQIAAGTIKEEDKSIYTYGYILTMEMILNVCISLVIAVLLHMLECFIVFSCMFIPLRIFCGGWHASKGWVCTVVSNLTITAVMLMVKYQIIPFDMKVLWIVELICVFIVFCTAPIEDSKKLLYDTEKSAYGEICKILYVFQLVLMVVFYCINGIEILETGMLAHVAIVISMLVALIHKYINKNGEGVL